MRAVVRIAISGTPGTGKASTCKALSDRGYFTLDLNAEAERLGHLGPPDADGVRRVDVEALARDLSTPAKVIFMHAHFAHLLPSNVVIVLRCDPRVLKKRLEARRWRTKKIQENADAEAIDVITQEAVEGGSPVFEIDTSSSTPSQAADAVLAILEGKTNGHEPGFVDWSDEVLSWY